MKTLIANWKMNLGLRDSVMLAKVAVGVLETCQTPPDVILAPSFTAIADVADAVHSSHVRVAAQNVAGYKEGAYTGQVSALQAREAGAQLAIIGHSEARAHFGEDDEQVAHKLSQLNQARMGAVVCVGETEAERAAGKAVAHVVGQVKAIFGSVDGSPVVPPMVAYEPRWAIGSGVIPSVHDVDEMHKAIRRTLEELDISGARVLYGGSITPANAVSFLDDKQIDGVLVGGASDDAADLSELIALAADVA